MKLALKVVLALVLGLFTVLATFGYVRLNREIALFESDMTRDHRLVGTTLGACIADGPQGDLGARARGLLGRVSSERPGIQFDWVPPDEPPSAPVADDDWLRTSVPIVRGKKIVGTIEVAETLDQRDAYVAKSLRNIGVVTAVLVGVVAFVVVVLGMWLIGRPLDQLADKARRVGEGDLTTPLALDRNDEVGELAVEMNRMCERLDEANRRARVEGTARIEALEQLRHADRLVTVGRLAAGVAHELGTPLNVVAGRAKMIQKGVEPAKASDYAAIIVAQADRMTAIIRQLLDFARHREPQKSRVDLRDIAESAVGLLGHLAEKRGVELRADVSSAPLSADRGQLEQVVTNFVVNAIQASPGRGKVTVSTGVVTGEDGEVMAMLAVRDEGEGMPEEVRVRVFEPFFTTKDVGEGSGLGLSVAHGIVEEHGGRINVDSAPGFGTTFSMYLPRGTWQAES